MIPLFSDEVVRGIESVPAEHRPAGLLDLSRFVVHGADFKQWAWRATAATLVRLLCADVSSMPDGAAAALAATLRAREAVRRAHR